MTQLGIIIIPVSITEVYYPDSEDISPEISLLFERDFQDSGDKAVQAMYVHPLYKSTRLNYCSRLV